MANDVSIAIGANTENFQVAIEKAFQTINKFGIKNQDLGSQIDKAYKQLALVAANMSDDVQASFNALNIKSDAAMKALAQTIKMQSQSAVADFNNLSQHALTTANDIQRAAGKMREMYAGMDASILKDEFKTLGIQSAASIEEMKLKQINALREIKTNVEISERDKVRATEVANLEIARLDGLLVTQAERDNAKKVALVREMLSSKVSAIAQATATEEKMYADAASMNQKFEYDKQRAAEKTANEKIRLLRELGVAERALYAAQGMTGEGSAAKLINQRHAGSTSTAEIKAQMESVVAAEKAAAQKVAIETESADARIRQINKLRAASVDAEVQKILAAEKAATSQKLLASETGNVAKATEKVRNGISGWSLASVAAIAKIQILYSLINNVMGAIGSAPGKAIDAIENYNTSLVTNAALITSMAGGTKNIGEEYKKNKVYAEAVEKVLVRMDTETSASYEQLQIMNRAYMQQGVYLDINNQKAIEGRRNTANALAVIAQATPNPNMQFGQEIRGLMNGTMKEGNALLKMLVGIDKDVVEKIERWKKAGTLDENIGKLLQGFAAAQGDIDNMWATVKSTMATIRDEVLRGGLAPAFGEIVGKLKEVNKWAGENKEAMQNWLKEGYRDIKVYGEGIWSIGKALTYLAKPAGYLVIAAGFMAIAKGISAMNIAIAATPVGAITGLIAAAALLMGKSALDSGYKGIEVQDIKSSVADPMAVRQGVSPDYYNNLTKNLGKNELSRIQSSLPWADAKQIAELIRYEAIKLKVIEATARTPKGVAVEINSGLVEQYRKFSSTPAPQTPKPGKGSEAGDKDKRAADTYNAFENDHYKALIKGVDEYNKKLNEQKDLFYGLQQESERTLQAEQNLFNLMVKSQGELKTSRYDVTNPYVDKKPSLLSEMFGPEGRGAVRYQSESITKNQYSIPQSAAKPIDAEKAEIARIRKKLKTDQMGFDNAEMRNTGGMWGSSDNYKTLENDFGKDKAEVQARLDELAIYKKLDAEQLASKKELLEKQIGLEQKYVADKKRIDAGNISSIGQSMGQIAAVMMKGNKEQFEAGKKMAIASATVQMFAAAAAAFSGITTSTGGWGIAAAIAAASAAVATGSAQIAQIASTHYEGREFGGPVRAGQSYIVGEKRPELFTPGASGVITPYVPSAGQGQTTSVTQVIQVSTGVADTVRSEIGRMMPMLRAQAVSAVMQAQRSGQMQAA